MMSGNKTKTTKKKQNHIMHAWVISCISVSSDSTRNKHFNSNIYGIFACVVYFNAGYCIGRKLQNLLNVIFHWNAAEIAIDDTSFRLLTLAFNILYSASCKYFHLKCMTRALYFRITKNTFFNRFYWLREIFYHLINYS